jgi:hypothetical protein
VIPSEFTSQQRAALAYHYLLQTPLTTETLAEKLGLTVRGTEQMLCLLSQVVPLYRQDGLWTVKKV